MAKCCARTKYLQKAPSGGADAGKLDWVDALDDGVKTLVYPGCLPAYVIVEFHDLYACPNVYCEDTPPQGFSTTFGPLPGTDPILIPRVINAPLNQDCYYCIAWGGPCSNVKVGGGIAGCICPPVDSLCYPNCIVCPDDDPPADADCSGFNGGSDHCHPNWIKVWITDGDLAQDQIAITVVAYSEGITRSYLGFTPCAGSYCESKDAFPYFDGAGTPLSASDFCDEKTQRVDNELTHACYPDEDINRPIRSGHSGYVLVTAVN